MKKLLLGLLLIPFLASAQQEQRLGSPNTVVYAPGMIKFDSVALVIPNKDTNTVKAAYPSLPMKGRVAWEGQSPFVHDGVGFVPFGSGSSADAVDSLASEDDSLINVYKQAGVLFQTLVHKGWSQANIQRVIDSTFYGFPKVRIMIGVLAPDSIPTVLNNPITWSFLFSNSQHEYNVCPDRQDSVTASGSSLLIHYNHCRLKNVMYGVACLDDAFSGYGMTFGTGVGERWMAIAATAKYEIGGYIYFDAPHTVTMGNGFKGNLSFSYDTTTAILTVANLSANYELTQEMWNLSLDYAGDNNYKWKRLRNSLPGSELTNLKYQLQDGATGSPITGGRVTSDVSFFRGNDVPQLVNLNIWDQYTQQLVFYNSNIWVMVVGEGY